MKSRKNKNLPTRLIEEVQEDLNSSSSELFIEGNDVTEVELVLPYGYYEQIRKYLFSDISKEYICQLLCGHTLIGNKLRLLACYQVFPESFDYLEQTMTSIRLDRNFDMRIRKECQESKFSLIDIHSHPFTTDGVNFSGVDDADEVEKYEYFKRNLPESIYGSIVMGQSSQRGRVFLSSSSNLNPRVLPIKIIRRDMPLAVTNYSDSLVNNVPRFDRQIRAFGVEGQNMLASISVGIVGLGGLGALMAIGLARLGVNKLTLIDPDTTDPSNLNRLAGMTSVDAKLGPYKVDMVARRITEIDSDIEVEKCPNDVFEPQTWQKLRDVDIIVAATDNHSTRMLLNSIANQYLVPLLSVGTFIRTREKQFENGFGELFSLIPGQSEPCLLCSQAIDKAEAYYELGPVENRKEAAMRGYVEEFDNPTPAIYHLNGIMSNLALVEIHNLACGFMERRPHLIYKMVERMLLTIEDEKVRCGVCSQDGLNFARGDMLDPVTNLFEPLN